MLTFTPPAGAALLALAFFLPASAHAAPAAVARPGTTHTATGPAMDTATWSPRAGTYFTPGGWGRLTIGGARRDGPRFTISTVGPAGHTCTPIGTIHGHEGEALVRGDTCVIGLRAEGNIVHVSPADTPACRAFCGSQASFDGPYVLAPAQCAPAPVRRTRDAFLRLYQRHEYGAARDRLRPLLEQCGAQLIYTTEAAIRNDLAVTYYHLRERGACRAVLEPLREIAGTDDAQVSELFPEFEARNQRRIARAARTNLRLCGVRM